MKEVLLDFLLSCCSGLLVVPFPQVNAFLILSRLALFHDKLLGCCGYRILKCKESTIYSEPEQASGTAQSQLERCLWVCGSMFNRYNSSSLTKCRIARDHTLNAES